LVRIPQRSCTTVDVSSEQMMLTEGGLGVDLCMEEVIVVGAGPYGLSVAANLRKHRIPFRVFGRTMHTWTDRMPQGMVLKSDGCATDLGAMPLTLEAFCQRTNRGYAHIGYRVPIEDMIAYGETLAHEYVGAIEDRQVEKINLSGSGFQVKLQTGEKVAANHVVVATGLSYLEHVPQIPGINGRLTHTSAHRDLSHFAGQRVAVIGGGQSALETAALLHENAAAQVIVVVRSNLNWLDDLSATLWKRIRNPYFGLAPGWKAWLWSSPSVYARFPDHIRVAYAYSTFKAGGTHWIRPRLESKVKFVSGEITKADVGKDIKLSFDTHQPLHVDHVIAGTGYVPDVRRVPLLESLLDRITWLAPGIPRLNNGFETSVPGLHVVGYLAAASLGPGMRFVYGTKYAGPWVAHHIARGR
jgi:cation diffusion facilitator CzcD-associated flavoprotein CzcO